MSVRSLASLGCALLCGASLLVGAAGCGHKEQPYDVARLETKCGIEPGRELTADELVCLAGVAGLKSTRKCPLDIQEGTFRDVPGTVWFVRESCGEIGIVVTRIGAIVAVEVGDAVAPPPATEPPPDA